MVLRAPSRVFPPPQSTTSAPGPLQSITRVRRSATYCCVEKIRVPRPSHTQDTTNRVLHYNRVRADTHDQWLLPTVRRRRRTNDMLCSDLPESWPAPARAGTDRPSAAE